MSVWQHFCLPLKVIINFFFQTFAVFFNAFRRLAFICFIFIIIECIKVNTKNMSLLHPFGPQNLSHLASGSHIRAIITSVHDRKLGKFSIRLVNMEEFKLTDVIEYGEHTLLGYNLSLPEKGMFGLGINGKVFRAILMEPLQTEFNPCAYLVDVGTTMPVRPEDPIYQLSPIVQSIPGTAIGCLHAGIVNPKTQPIRWRYVQECLEEGKIVGLKIVRSFDTILHVLFAAESEDFETFENEDVSDDSEDNL